MLAAWWLAIAGLPVFTQPLPASPGEPAALALAAGRLDLRQPCLSLRCADAEWRAAATPIAATVSPARDRLPRPAAPVQLQSRRFAPLWVRASARDWVASSADGSRVLTQYGVDAVRDGDTRVQWQVGTGYRFEPYADEGTAAVGPIARGAVTVSQRVGERVRLTQQLRLEAGRENAFLRQSIGLDYALQPQWLLRSRWLQRHDSQAGGRTDQEGSVELRYAF